MPPGPKGQKRPADVIGNARCTEAEQARSKNEGKNIFRVENASGGAPAVPRGLQRLAMPPAILVTH